MGCWGRQTPHYDVNAVFVYLCLCEQWGWSQQERWMYYSDVSDSVVVRWCGATLKVSGPAMLFLPVLSALTSCTGHSPKSSSAGVSDLSQVYAMEKGNCTVCSSQDLVSCCHSEIFNVCYFLWFVNGHRLKCAFPILMSGIIFQSYKFGEKVSQHLKYTLIHIKDWKQEATDSLALSKSIQIYTIAHPWASDVLVVARCAN